ncbi:MAG: response regulator [Chloroflexi bacterium]|nr:response regulator [Chloroflexota bacterium]
MTDPLAIIIEDDPQLSHIFCVTLQNDFHVEPILDGTEALIRLSQVIPRLILLDLNLPGVSGTDLLASIRSDARLKETTIILCTADNRQANAIQEQADYVLLKPVSPVQLRQLASRLR